MKKKEIFESGDLFITKLVKEFTINGLDAIIADFAGEGDIGWEEDKWQARELYLSQKGKDDYKRITASNSDDISYGIVHDHRESTWIAEKCKHLNISACKLMEIVDEINTIEHLDSVGYSLLEK